MDGLTTGELAKLGGVNLEAIRFYERQGLLPKPPRTPSGYRTFPADSVSRVRFIKRAQALGFTLKEVKELLALRRDPDTQCADVRERARRKIADVEQKLRDLQKIKRALTRLADECAGSGSAVGCSVLQALEGERDSASEAGKDRR